MDNPDWQKMGLFKSKPAPRCRADYLMKMNISWDLIKPWGVHLDQPTILMWLLPLNMEIRWVDGNQQGVREDNLTKCNEDKKVRAVKYPQLLLLIDPDKHSAEQLEMDATSRYICIILSLSFSLDAPPPPKKKKVCGSWSYFGFKIIVVTFCFLVGGDQISHTQSTVNGGYERPHKSG